MKFELNFVGLKPHFTVNKLTTREKSESGEGSEALAEDQDHSVSEGKSPRAEHDRHLAFKSSILKISATMSLYEFHNHIFG